MRRWVILALCLAVLLLAISGCADSPGSSPDFDQQLNSIVRPYSFNFAVWEFETLFSQSRETMRDRETDYDLSPETVLSYFAYVDRLKTLQSEILKIESGEMTGELDRVKTELAKAEVVRDRLRRATEQTIARQISETLAKEGIYNPLGSSRFKLIFPPVNFKLEKPIFILLVSPRDKIERKNEFTIKQEISPTEIEELENTVDNLEVSSLVIEIGGMGATYPSFVVESGDLRFTIEVACEEWLHQYLAFTPLGFGYVLHLLGLPVQASIPTINETVASIAGRELGQIVYDYYYAQSQKTNEEPMPHPTKPSFDFNKIMRDTRRRVDELLGRGEIEAAEKYMREQRDYLAENGYYIRKLNQAYFAFYGSYADSPTSIDPIGDEVRALKAHSLSLKEFLDRAAGLKNREQLTKLVEGWIDK